MAPTSWSQPPPTRGKTLNQPVSKAQSREANLSVTANNIWKILLLLSALVFLNLVSVTQNVLVSPGSSQHNGLESSWKALRRNFTRTSSHSIVSVPEGNNLEDDENQLSTAQKQQEQEQKIEGTDVENNGGSDHRINAKQIEESPADYDLLQVPSIKTRKATQQARKVSNATEPVPTDQIQYIPRKKKNERQQRLRRQHRQNRLKKKEENKTLTPEEKLKYTYEETAIMSNVSNDVYYKDIPPEYLAEDPSVFLWDRADAMVPEWMKDYFRWHRWKRSTWKSRRSETANSNSTENDWWKSERWLISQCLLSQDKKKCGGTADRLKPIPTLLRIAYDTKRVFLIRWTRPAPLEEFLLPPVGGFDWRVPPDLAEVMEDDSNGKRLRTKKPILEYGVGGMALIRTRYQVSFPGTIYNTLIWGEEYFSAEERHEPNNDKHIYSFDEVFSRMWKVFFTPSLPVQSIVRSKLTGLGLVPNEYVASHLRALYAVDSRPTELIHNFTENALACATEVFPGAPIFFASDSTIALNHAREFNGREVRESATDGGRSVQLRVVTPVEVAEPKPTPVSGDGDKNSSIAPINQPWHLDSFTGPVENFYDTFVDLYLLAIAGCVTFNKGGYGHWGMLIGGHTQCQKAQFIIGKTLKDPEKDFCRFHATDNKDKATSIDGHPSVFGNDRDAGPLFLLPMD